MYRYLRFVPKNHLSRAVGRLVHLRLPDPLARRLVRWFATTYRIDVDAAEHEIHHYRSIGEFFTRNLRTGLRPIESDLVSPVDGTLRNFGPVTGGRLPQIKGKSYTLGRFLGDEAAAARYDNGVFFNFYLSPQDYHHVHSPVSGTVRASTHVPGKLWPVNDWSMSTVDELFSINERVVTWIDSSFGLVAVVMIGATNVGEISVTYDDFISNRAVPETVTRKYDPAKPIAAGDRLGTFHMGSSVVVLLEPGKIDVAAVRLEENAKVRYGSAMLHSK